LATNPAFDRAAVCKPNPQNFLARHPVTSSALTDAIGFAGRSVPLVRSSKNFEWVIRRSEPRFGVRCGMRFTALVAMLVCCLAFPSVASPQDVTSIPPAQGPLLRSGVVALQRLSLEQDRVIAAQLQHTKLKNDKKTTIILIAIVAVAALIWFETQLAGIG